MKWPAAGRRIADLRGCGCGFRRNKNARYVVFGSAPGRACSSTRFQSITLPLNAKGLSKLLKPGAKGDSRVRYQCRPMDGERGWSGACLLGFDARVLAVDGVWAVDGGRWGMSSMKSMAMTRTWVCLSYVWSEDDDGVRDQEQITTGGSWDVGGVWGRKVNVGRRARQVSTEYLGGCSKVTMDRGQASKNMSFWGGGWDTAVRREVLGTGGTKKVLCPYNTRSHSESRRG